jgi:hypothetical protein
MRSEKREIGQKGYEKRGEARGKEWMFLFSCKWYKYKVIESNR